MLEPHTVSFCKAPGCIGMRKGGAGELTNKILREQPICTAFQWIDDLAGLTLGLSCVEFGVSGLGRSNWLLRGDFGRIQAGLAINGKWNTVGGGLRGLAVLVFLSHRVHERSSLVRRHRNPGCGPRPAWFVGWIRTLQDRAPGTTGIGGSRCRRPSNRSARPGR